MEQNVKFIDYYEVLNVWPTADADAIKKAIAGIEARAQPRPAPAEPVAAAQVTAPLNLQDYLALGGRRPDRRETGARRRA